MCFVCIFFFRCFMPRLDLSPSRSFVVVMIFFSSSQSLLLFTTHLFISLWRCVRYLARFFPDIMNDPREMNKLSSAEHNILYRRVCCYFFFFNYRVSSKHRKQITTTNPTHLVKLMKRNRLQTATYKRVCALYGLALAHTSYTKIDFHSSNKPFTFHS